MHSETAHHEDKENGNGSVTQHLGNMVRRQVELTYCRNEDEANKVQGKSQTDRCAGNPSDAATSPLEPIRHLVALKFRGFDGSISNGRLPSIPVLGLGPSIHQEAFPSGGPRRVASGRCPASDFAASIADNGGDRGGRMLRRIPDGLRPANRRRRPRSPAMSAPVSVRRRRDARANLGGSGGRWRRSSRRSGSGAPRPRARDCARPGPAHRR